MTQIGVIVDLLDEFYFLRSAWWHYVGDTLYFIGGSFIVVGVSQWLDYTYRQSTIDSLTKVYNRRFFGASLEKHFAQMDNGTAASCLVCIDLDDFKQINDGFGHDMGDRVLKLVASVLKRTARKDDIVCRSGGEEFEVLLINTDISQGAAFANRIAAAMRAETPSELNPITASIGITAIHHEDGVDSVRLRADAAMYEAKNNGKDRIIIA